MEVKKPNREVEKELTEVRPWWKRLWAWTQFEDKSGWDWLQLLIVPLVLAAAGFWFAAQQDQRQQAVEQQRAESEQRVEEQRSQDAALQAYLDQMSTLLLEKDLRESEEDSEVRTLARARTLTVLRRLGPDRKATVAQFLHESSLINADSPVIELGGADLRDAELSGAQLTNANLSGADLSGANLDDAELAHAILIDAELAEANLSDAYMMDADFSDANLNNADLSGYLWNAHFFGSIDFRGADLSHANLGNSDGLTDYDLEKVESLKGTTLPNLMSHREWIEKSTAVKLQSGPGPLLSGKYVTDEFEPGFSFEVGKSWGYGSPETSDSVDLWGPWRGQLLFTQPRHVFDPGDPSALKEISAPLDKYEWTIWLQRHPNLETSTPHAMVVGGYSGWYMDVTTTSTPENHPQDVCGDQPCVPLFAVADSQIVSYPGWKDRFVFVDVGDETVVIDVSAPTEFDEFSRFLPEAQKVLDTVDWQGSS